VVPSQFTAEYTRIWPHATAVTLERTGHLGLVTRPEEFARVIVGFAEDAGAGLTASAKATASLAEAERRRKTGGYVRESERRVG
jgi:hypothetical protein